MIQKNFIKISNQNFKKFNLLITIILNFSYKLRIYITFIAYILRKNTNKLSFSLIFEKDLKNILLLVLNMFFICSVQYFFFFKMKKQNSGFTFELPSKKLENQKEKENEEENKENEENQPKEEEEKSKPNLIQPKINKNAYKNQSERRKRLLFYNEKNHQIEKKLKKTEKQLNHIEKEYNEKYKEYQENEQKLAKAELFLDKLDHLIGKYEELTKQQTKEEQNVDRNSLFQTIRYLNTELISREGEIEAFNRECYDLDQLLRAIVDFSLTFDELKSQAISQGFYMKKAEIEQFQNQNKEVFIDISQYNDNSPLMTLISTDITFTKSLFSDDLNYDKIIDDFNSYIKYQHPNSPFYLVRLIHRFAFARPKNLDLVPRLFSSLLLYFHDKKQAIHDYVKTKYANSLYNILTDTFRSFSIDHIDFSCRSGLKTISIYENGTLFSSIKNDDLQAFLDFKLEDFNEEIPISDMSATWVLLDNKSSITLLDFAAFFGSLQIFNFLLQNGCSITNLTIENAIAGGNQEILNIIDKIGVNYSSFIFQIVKFHRHSLFDRVLNDVPQRNQNSPLKVHFIFSNLSIPYCINFFNFYSFISFLRKGFSLVEEDENENSIFHISAMHGFVPLIVYLINQNYEPDQRNSFQKDSFQLACEEGHFSVVKLLAEAAHYNVHTITANGHTMRHIAKYYNFTDIEDYLNQLGVEDK